MREHEEKLYDVVIAGGGLAGTALALALADLDMRVALVEMHASPKVGDGPERVIALSHGSRCCLDDLGVWSDIEALGVAPIRHICAHEPGNRGEVHMDHHQAGVEALGYVVENDGMLRVMRDRLAQQAAVDLFSPASVQCFVDAGERLWVNIADESGERRLGTRLLVGADGSHSPVRRMSGIGSVGWDHNRFGLVASVRTEHPHRGWAYECFRAPGPLAFLPLDEARCSIVWTLPPMEAGRMMTASDSAFMAALNRAAGSLVGKALGEVLHTGARACFPFEFRQAKHYVAPRVALIGNAAHTLHPVAGQGLNLGLRDVAALADVLAGECRAGRDPGGPIALEQYWQRRAGDTVAVASFTEGLNLLFAPDLRSLKAARGFGMSAMQRLPFARDWLMRQASGLGQMNAGRRRVRA
ncbi:MAG TPA: FAD-dependent monooxygenase [Mariprofundaceae bacterium]|nr:FAD-dependent monooxygenase [Mariprofundaceae bacterium]